MKAPKPGASSKGWRPAAFLPTYSPDCNPIEQAFAKIKQALRRFGTRSRDTLVAAIGDALPTVTAADARAFFTEAGFPCHDTT